MEIDWTKEFPVAITVTDKNGIIVEMNNKSAEVFSGHGGRKLIGSQLNNCHNANSQSIIAQLEQNKMTNIYTIEKNGVKKLIFQGPWLKDGEFAGLVELSIVLPENLPHFIR